MDKAPSKGSATTFQPLREMKHFGESEPSFFVAFFLVPHDSFRLCQTRISYELGLGFPPKNSTESVPWTQEAKSLKELLKDATGSPNTTVSRDSFRLTAKKVLNSVHLHLHLVNLMSMCQSWVPMCGAARGCLPP